MDDISINLPRDDRTESEAPAFILVHGTWAPKAPWTLKGSAIWQRLQIDFPGCSIERVEWSGKNRFRDRLEASLKIQKKCEPLVAERRTIYLVGHSHGGSAIVYALRGSPRLAGQVAGIVLMSTPFFALDVRIGFDALFKAMVGAGVLVLTIGLAYAMVFFLQTGSWSGPLWRDWMGLGGATTIAAVGAFTVIKAIKCRAAGFLVRRVRRVARLLETTRTPKLPFLILRTTGDEVAIAMGFAQLLCLMSNTMTTIAIWPITWIASIVGQVWKYTWGRVGLVVGLMIASLAIALAAAVGKMFGFPLQNGLSVLNPFSRNWGAMDEHIGTRLLWYVELLYRLFLGIEDVVASAILLFTALSFAAGSAAILTSVLTYRLFGSWSVYQALGLEMAAEPIPRGLRMYFHVPWEDRLRERAEGHFRLRHSEPYTASAALDAMCDWIRKPKSQ